jgi:hypothetical protein
MAFPDDMVHVRSALPPNVPVRNQTLGSCRFLLKNSPVLSATGLLSSGSFEHHYHHIADQSSHDLLKGLDSREYTSGLSLLILLLLVKYN